MAHEKVTFKKVKKYIPLYVMMIPGLAYLIINNYMPMPGLVVAFKTYNARQGIYGSPWCGLANFQYLFQTSDAWVITRNTISNMQAGIVYGYVGQVDYIVRKMKSEIGGTEHIRVIATGGLSRMIASETSTIDIIDGLLTLKGLRLLYERNARA